MPSARSTSPPKSACPGRVDDVDALAVPHDGGVLRQDGDAALALQGVAVHHALDDLLVLAEHVGLASMPSTSVVLPWSTWAMMARLR
jgi:hypothetical protein